MFYNRWAALAFVGLVVFGAVNLIGSEDDQGLLLRSANDLEEQREGMAREVERISSPVASPHQELQSVAGEFGVDEDLIDAAEGFDPTPIVATEPGKETDAGDVVIVQQDSGDNYEEFVDLSQDRVE